jgi:AraC-like DNA-binding protein
LSYNEVIIVKERIPTIVMDRIRISYNAVAHIERFGVSRLAVLQQARLPFSLLQDKRPVVSTSQWFALWKALETLNDDPALGLKIGSDIPVDVYDPVFISGLCAHTFREALYNVGRYKQQFCSEEMRVVEDQNLCQIEIVWTATQEPTPHLLVDGLFASQMMLLQRGSGLALYPERIRFARKAQNLSLYQNFFHCPVDFDAESNAIIFSTQMMDTPFHTFNPDMLALLLPQLEAQLNEGLAQQSLSQHVKLLLQTRLPRKQPTMQQIAQELNISSRTLQRQLSKEGTGFQQLLDLARHELAQKYLQTASLDLSEIAYLLGYEEASSFHRAFHQWEGVSPGQWRTTHLKGMASASAS